MLTVLIIAVSLVSFYLGRLSVGDSGHIPASQAHSASVIETKIVESQASAKATSSPTTQASPQAVGAEQGKYVASKSGTKYHLPWCAGAKQIKEENKVWFASKEEAEKAGYTPAANCKGI